MKDATHHLKHVQRKVIRAARKDKQIPGTIESHPESFHTKRSGAKRKRVE